MVGRETKQDFHGDQVGQRLRDLRAEREWSLDRTAGVCGVSKAMLGQVERGESSPTIATLWKIASGFRVSLSYFLVAQRDFMPDQPLQIYEAAAEEVRRDPSGMTVRALVPYDAALGFELFAIDLYPGALSESTAHAPNVVEHVTVIEGDLSVRVADRWHALKAGQTLRFAADVAHAYHNPGGDIARVHDLIHYLRVED